MSANLFPLVFETVHSTIVGQGYGGTCKYKLWWTTWSKLSQLSSVNISTYITVSDYFSQHIINKHFSVSPMMRFIDRPYIILGPLFPFTHTRQLSLSVYSLLPSIWACSRDKRLRHWFILLRVIYLLTLLFAFYLDYFYYSRTLILFKMILKHLVTLIYTHGTVNMIRGYVYP